jgi:hypothetical protein
MAEDVMVGTRIRNEEKTSRSPQNVERNKNYPWLQPVEHALGLEAGGGDACRWDQLQGKAKKFTSTSVLRKAFRRPQNGASFFICLSKLKWKELDFTEYLYSIQLGLNILLWLL